MVGGPLFCADQVDLGGQPLKCAPADARPRHGCELMSAVRQHHLVCLVAIRIRVRLADDQTAGADQVSAAAQQPTDVAADADVAVQEQRGAPTTLARQQR